MNIKNYLLEKKFILGQSEFKSLAHAIVYLTNKGKDYSYIKKATGGSDTMIKWYIKHPEDVKGSVDPVNDIHPDIGGSAEIVAPPKAIKPIEPVSPPKRAKKIDYKKEIINKLLELGYTKSFTSKPGKLDLYFGAKDTGSIFTARVYKLINQDVPLDQFGNPNVYVRLTAYSNSKSAAATTFFSSMDNKQSYDFIMTLTKEKLEEFTNNTPQLPPVQPIAPVQPPQDVIYYKKEIIDILTAKGFKMKFSSKGPGHQEYYRGFDTVTTGNVQHQAEYIELIETPHFDEFRNPNIRIEYILPIYPGLAGIKSKLASNNGQPDKVLATSKESYEFVKGLSNTLLPFDITSITNPTSSTAPVTSADYGDVLVAPAGMRWTHFENKELARSKEMISTILGIEAPSTSEPLIPDYGVELTAKVRNPLAWNRVYSDGTDVGRTNSYSMYEFATQSGVFDGEAAQNAPWIVAAAMMTPGCKMDRRGSGKYHHSTQLHTMKINLGKSEDEKGVFRHEFGHHMDHVMAGNQGTTFSVGAYTSFAMDPRVANNLNLRQSMAKHQYMKSSVEFEKISKDFMESCTFDDENELSRIGQQFDKDGKNHVAFRAMFDNYVKTNLPHFEPDELYKYIEKDIVIKMKYDGDKDTNNDITMQYSKLTSIKFMKEYIGQTRSEMVNAVILKIVISMKNQDVVGMSTASRLKFKDRTCFNGISDMADFIEHGNIQKFGNSGHGSSYWKTSGDRCASEFFAHYVDTQAGESTTGAKIFRYMFSQECKLLDNKCKQWGSQKLKKKGT